MQRLYCGEVWVETGIIESWLERDCNMFSGEQHFRQDPTEVPQGGTDRAPYTNTEKKELIESLEDGIYPTHEKSETYGTAEFGGGLSV